MYKTLYFSNQLIDSQRRNTRRQSWIKKLFEHILSMSIMNSLCIKRQLSQQPLPVLNFKRELMESLFKIGKGPQVTFNNMNLQSTNLPPPTKYFFRIFLYIFQVERPIRDNTPTHENYKSEGHHMSTLPNSRSRLCELPHSNRGRTRKFCPICDVSLCTTDCYVEWHFFRK